MPAARDIPQLYAPAETAAMLGVCEKTLQQCRAMGLRYVQITRGAIQPFDGPPIFEVHVAGSNSPSPLDQRCS